MLLHVDIGQRGKKTQLFIILLNVNFIVKIAREYHCARKSSPSTLRQSLSGSPRTLRGASGAAMYGNNN